MFFFSFKRKPWIIYLQNKMKREQCKWISDLFSNDDKFI